MAHAHNLPKSEQKPYFTDYTVAGTDQGRIHAAIKRAIYAQGRSYIRTTRSLKRMCRHTAIEPRVASQQLSRGGFPIKRERDEDIPSKRGVAHSKFLKQFKLVYNRAEDACKIYVLHATRGWKFYA